MNYWPLFRPWRLLIAVAALSVSCDALAEAVELPLAVSMSGEIPAGKTIDSYPMTVAAVVGVMAQKFNLPPPNGKVLIYRTRQDFEQGLVEHLKLEPGLAHATSEFAKSAVGNCNVLVNEPLISGSPWPKRIELLAHELTHSAQLTLANRCGLPREQWMLEGTAEWMAYNVTAALQLDDLNDVRRRLKAKVLQATRKDGLPQLTHLGTFQQWVAARKKYGFDGTYSLSFLVADFLVTRHSFDAVAQYFRAFGKSLDHGASFSAAFGESPEAFDRALEEHLKALLR